METSRVMTKQYSILDLNSSTGYYNYLRDNIQWEEGVKSRKTGFTRLAKPLNVGDNQVVDYILADVFNKLSFTNKYQILGIYLNYYKDGTHHTPSHTHKGMTQLVVSLGATRTLKVGSKNYQLNNGDVIIFGSSAHSIPIESNVTEGRISIATFMIPIQGQLIS
jgi:hypothetical protein